MRLLFDKYAYDTRQRWLAFLSKEECSDLKLFVGIWAGDQARNAFEFKLIKLHGVGCHPTRAANLQSEQMTSTTSRTLLNQHRVAHRDRDLTVHKL